MGSRHRHIRKFANGQMTPEEYHSKFAFPPHAKCQACPSRPMTRVIILMEMKEARKNPLIDQWMLVDPASFMSNVVQIRGSDGKPTPYWRVSVVYACKACTPALEKQAAKAPSHCIVEINHGPDPKNRIVA